MKETRPVTELMQEIRLFYNSLVQIGESMHEDSDLTLGARAVLEYLHREGDETVPRIADARRVSRQRIQALVNELRVKDLVEPVPNPRSQRSPLIRMTKEGILTLRRMYKRESTYMKRISASDREIESLLGKLRKIRSELEANES